MKAILLTLLTLASYTTFAEQNFQSLIFGAKVMSYGAYAESKQLISLAILPSIN